VVGGASLSLRLISSIHGCFANLSTNTSAVWLHAVKSNKEANREVLAINFVKYTQSSRVRAVHESSVSYASAVARKVSHGEAS